MFLFTFVGFTGFYLANLWSFFVQENEDYRNSFLEYTNIRILLYSNSSWNMTWKIVFMLLCIFVTFKWGILCLLYRSSTSSIPLSKLHRWTFLFNVWFSHQNPLTSLLTFYMTAIYTSLCTNVIPRNELRNLDSSHYQSFFSSRYFSWRLHSAIKYKVIFTVNVSSVLVFIQWYFLFVCFKY